MAFDEAQPVIPGSLKRFKVAGFRRLVDVEVELGPFNVLIGPNGGGKTSFLDAIEMMARTLKRDLKSFIAEFNGFGQILSTGNASKQIEIEASLFGEEAEGLYRLRIESFGYGHSVAEESLYVTFDDLNREGGHKIGWQQSPKPIPLSGAKLNEEGGNLYFEGDPDFKIIQGIRNTINIPTISTTRRAPVRAAQRVSPVMWQYPDGSDLCIRLLDIQQRSPQHYDSILETLKVAFPCFQRLELKIVGDSFIGLYWHETKSPLPLGAGQLSDGILRFLWLLSILYHPDCPPVVLFDEPESHFHPKLIQILVEVFRECSRWTQIIATTHSATIVRFIKPEELLVMDDDELGKVRIQRASDLNLAHWLEDFTLDEIWSLGRLSDQE
jgi:predicted ATPase